MPSVAGARHAIAANPAVRAVKRPRHAAAERARRIDPFPARKRAFAASPFRVFAVAASFRDGIDGARLRLGALSGACVDPNRQRCVSSRTALRREVDDGPPTLSRYGRGDCALRRRGEGAAASDAI